jgi:hypothetical protein
MSKLVGIWGNPYIDLESVLDTSPLDEIDEEVCYGLPQVEVSYTGGSLKWLGVAAPWIVEDEYVDLGHVIEEFSREEFEKLVSLADDPSLFDVDRYQEYEFGDETEHPLNRKQMLYLKYKYGVYFPWKAAYHLLENVRWEDKHSGAGKDFSEEAKRVFPKTVAYIQSLPFREIGRCVIFGIEANDHATLHRDSEPGKDLGIPQCINICPRADKEFYLCDADDDEVVQVQSRLFWFNDMDYHGVDPAPYFRYSIRIDGMFEPSFVDKLQNKFGRKRRTRRHPV